jgi:phosphate transport system permease protein
MSAAPVPGSPHSGPHGDPPPIFVSDARLRRRKALNRAMEGLATLAAILAVAVLAIMVGSVLVRGAGAFDGAFFTSTEALFGETGGGIAHAIVGSATIVVLATLISVPVGVLVAIYTSEFARPTVARLVRMGLDILNGIPSIVIGIFIFGLLVVGHGQAAWKASVALSIIMLPLVARSTQEVLALVPATLREAALGVGASKWRMVLGVVLPASLGGISTGASLAVARVAGETAPILFTSSIAVNSISTDVSRALQTIPVLIFSYSEAPDPAMHEKAWAAAILLIGFVLVTSLASRMLMTRMRRKLEGGSRAGVLGKVTVLLAAAARGRR